MTHPIAMMKTCTAALLFVAALLLAQVEPASAAPYNGDIGETRFTSDGRTYILKRYAKPSGGSGGGGDRQPRDHRAGGDPSHERGAPSLEHGASPAPTRDRCRRAARIRRRGSALEHDGQRQTSGCQVPQAARGAEPARDHDRHLGDLGRAPPGERDGCETGARRPGARGQSRRSESRGQRDGDETHESTHEILRHRG